MSSSEVENDFGLPTTPRKRPRNEDNWKRNKAKCARNKGESYDTHKGNTTVRARSVGPPCKCGCYENIGSDNVKEIFNNFWEIGNYNEQNAFLALLISRTEIKRSRIKDRESRKKHGISYTVMHNNKVYTVCRKAFINIHDISERRIRTVLDKKDLTGVTKLDNRGKKDSSHLKISQERRQSVIDNINTILQVLSIDRELESPYLPPDMTVVSMYKSYLDWLKDNGIETQPVSQYYYRDVFNSEFKWLKRGKPKDLTE